MLDAVLNKRPKQPVFADTIEAEEIEMVTQVCTEASASPPAISPQWVKGKVQTPHSHPTTVLCRVIG